ncbi:hypothetical protein A3C59_01665 [Candidatus Daviesbacteria bacterium RIFCSPHIGHO2_02_FULL_36_13]|uniref:DOD-type homing endonuclease domain-containing protein n=1 Tax=Candidatus Daviesbacteria bacterium RIFCSPHIGHO2_02_FULL_36_13 TaxID=1797768 RepID=A0A1F5JTB2_9BACT|nr:MAG: hypothetical protein A3C59_01665 [Candidatus Daviesbacteria bacterium RIFCSPHIGHO2_02_FULL_36_13]
MISSKNILRKTLINLYLDQKLSTSAISRILECKSHVTILNYLKKYNIPRRSRLGNRISINISKETLIDLYYNKKLTQKQIAKNFGNKSTTGIHSLMKTYGLKSKSDSEFHTKYSKFDFSGNLEDKAYLLGFRLGDLNIYKVHYLIQARCSSTIKEQANLFKNIFRRYGYVNITIAKRGTYEMIVLLNDSFSFLLPKNDSVEHWILKKEKYFLSFLAGYADAEGSYYLRKPYYKHAKSGWGVFEIQSYDKGILKHISQKLQSIGIEHKFYQTKGKRIYKKEMWRLSINRKQSLWDFIKLLTPYHKHKNKINELNEVKNNLILRNSLPYCRPINL